MTEVDWGSAPFEQPIVGTRLIWTMSRRMQNWWLRWIVRRVVAAIWATTYLAVIGSTSCKRGNC
jgi:hypothetical protein